MKEKLTKIVKDLKEQMTKYAKDPRHINASGELIEKAKPKYYWLLGKINAYENILSLLEE